MVTEDNSNSDSSFSGNPQPLEIYNLDYLKRMSGGDHRFLKEMINIFLSHVPLEIEKLREAAKENDLETAKQVAHKLKSSASMMGANRILFLIEKFDQEKDRIDAGKAVSAFYLGLSQEFVLLQSKLELLN
jgi:HPt (histidine-containing phosphotransfer) domain-containing protein